MGNNSLTKGKTRLLARIIIAVMAVCLALTAAPFLAPESIPVAKADNVTLLGTSRDQINSDLADYASGTVVDLVLQNDISVDSGSGDQLTTGTIDGIIIPSGRTVNLYLNGFRVYFSRIGKGNSAFWRLTGLRAIVNRGTLNVYSGSGPSSPNRQNADASQSSIYLYNSRTEMDSGDDRETAYVRLEGITNEGTLTVNRNVTVFVKSELAYADKNAGWPNDATATSAIACVYNASTANSVTLNSAKLFAHIDVRSLNDKKHTAESRAYAYCVYGGSVTSTGDSEFSTTTLLRNSESGSISNKEGKVVGYAVGICSNGSIKISGGTFSYASDVSSDHNALENGTAHIYQCGVFHLSGALPEISDATINVADKNTFSYNVGNKNYWEATVLTSTSMPWSPVQVFSEATNNLYSSAVEDANYPARLATTVNAGQFNDEAGNTYTVDMSTNPATHPISLDRGAAFGSYRVHVIYRYWLDSGKNNIDTSVVSSDGKVGYSYRPRFDGTHIVKNDVEFSGITPTNYVRAGSSGLQYRSGGEVENSYYWHLFNISYSSNITSWMSDVDFTASTMNGTVMTRFENGSPVMNNEIGATTQAPIYLFVDYVKKVPARISMTVGKNTAVYTGLPILAGALNPTVRNEMVNEDITAEYNLDCSVGSSLIPVKYSWEGTTAAGVSLSGTDTVLPTKVGTYQVTAKFADDTAYSMYPDLHKNRLAYEYTFSLTITPAEVTRGTLISSVNLTYGETLGNKLNLATSGYIAYGVNNERPDGSFFFKNASDATGFKPVGNANVEIVWTPSTPNGDYKQTSFGISYTVAKALLRIRPLAASVVYGDSVFSTPYAVTYEGLVANDNNDTVKSAINEVLGYTLYMNGGWIPYLPGETPAGSYPIKATVTNPSIECLKNYNYETLFGLTDNPEGNLTVSKRPITVKATAESRPYSPTNENVNVSFEILSGKLTADDLGISNTLGTLSNKNAGTQIVQGINSTTVPTLFSGSKSGNYVLGELQFSTGTQLTVVITKATPDVSLPSLGTVFYKRLQTLNDISLPSDSSVGTWQWVDRSINPTVAVTSYSARFTPKDNTNYDSIVTDVPLTVRPTPVVITYSSEVSYGDNVPNITSYTYSSPNDPDFSIDAVTTSGNINVSTTYTPGSVVSTQGYTVTISAPNYKDVNGNYTFTSQDGIITVKPRTIVFTVSNAEITYGDNFAATPDLVSFDESRLVGDDTAADITSNGSQPTFTVRTEYNVVTNYNAGNYALTASANFTTNSNYVVEIVNGNLNVKKADLKIRAKNVNVTYGTEAPDLSSQYTLVGAKKGDTLTNAVSLGTVVFGTDYSAGSPVNSEGYRFYVDISGAIFNNYNVSVENATLFVEKANPVITGYPQASVVYGQTLGEAVFTGGSVNVGGNYVFDRGDITPAWQEAPWTIYTATFVPSDTVNYNTVKNIIVALTVSKKVISGDLAVIGNPMFNELLTVDVSGLDPDTIGTYTFVWKIGGVQVGTGSTLLLNNESYVNKEVTVIATATGYYTGSATYVTTKIAPTLTSVTDILTDEQFANFFNITGLVFNGSNTTTYNGNSNDVTIGVRPDRTAIARIGAITVKYNGSTVVPVSAGTYNVTIDIATPSFGAIQTHNGITYDGETVVYSPISNFPVGTLVIGKAPYDVTVSVNDKVYDGYTTAEGTVVSEKGALTLAGGTKDDVRFDRASFVFSDANVGNAKTVTYTDAVLTGDAARNYELNLTLANGGKANITPRKLLVTANPISREYEDGNYNVDVSFVVNNASIAPTDSSASIGVNEETAFGTVDDFRVGTRKVTLSGVELTGSKRANYVLEITNLSTLSVQIQKATPSYPIPFVGDVTYDSGRHLSDIKLGDTRWSWDYSVMNDIPTAGQHVYIAVYTPDDTANYAKVSYEVSFTVNKAPVQVRAGSFNVVYGDIEPTYYATHSGLTGSDSEKNLNGYILLRCAYTAGSNVGTYPITIDGQYESENYVFTYIPGTVTVKPRTAYVTAEAVNREYAAGKLDVTVNFSALSNLRPGDEGNVFLAASSVVGTVANDTAGKKSVEYVLPELSGVSAVNYDLRILNPDITVEILKARLPGVVLPVSAVISYGNKLSTATWTSSLEGAELGTFSMKDPMSTPRAVGTFSNEYKVVFTPYNSINYATVEQYIELTVERAVLNVEMSITGVLSTGSKVFVVTNSLPLDAPGYIVFNWYRMDDPNGDIRNGKLVSYNTSEYTLTESDEGKYLVAVAQNTADSPYIVNARCASDGTVEQPKLSFWQKILKFFYNVVSAISAVFGRIL